MICFVECADMAFYYDGAGSELLLFHANWNRRLQKHLLHGDERCLLKVHFCFLSNFSNLEKHWFNSFYDSVDGNLQSREILNIQMVLNVCGFLFLWIRKWFFYLFWGGGDLLLRCLNLLLLLAEQAPGGKEASGGRNSEETSCKFQFHKR